MNFDNIPETQIFEGHTVDIIFPKKFNNARQSRRRLYNPEEEHKDDAALQVKISSQQEPVASSTSGLLDRLPDTQTSSGPSTQSPVPFSFTNENIFMEKQSRSLEFNRFFPVEVLHFDDEELQTLNDLYRQLRRRPSETPQLNKTNDLEKTSLIERFLKDNETQPLHSVSLDSGGLLRSSES